MREVIAIGKTVEEATENACAQLGLGRDEVSVEILEMPAKKLFKTTPAKVRVVSDADLKAAEQAAEKAAAAPVAEKPAAKSEGAPAPRPAPAAPEAKPQQKPAEARAVLAVEPEEDIDLEARPRVKIAVEYLASIFRAMGADDIQITAKSQGDATLLKVEGDGPAQVIDIKGEVIQALSYLVDRSINAGVDKKDPEFLRIRLDVAGYRSRRETELIALAQRTGEEVARTGRSKTLAPMNPYERLIVHTAISAIEGITSESKGSDVERRVVIRSLAANATEGEDWRPPRQGGGGSRGPRGGGRDRGGDRDRGSRSGGGRSQHGSRDRNDRGGPRAPRSSAPEREFADRPVDTSSGPVVPQRREAIKDGDDLPLYGKIEL